MRVIEECAAAGLQRRYGEEDDRRRKKRGRQRLGHGGGMPLIVENGARPNTPG